MKHCSKCGIRLDDNASFCIECGGTAVFYNDGSNPDYSDVSLISQQGGVAGIIREFAKSNIFLAAVIVYTVAAVFGLISSVINVFAANRLADSALVEVYGSATVVGELMGVVMGMAPTILVLVGLWMTYLSAKSNDERMKTSGLGMIKVISIIMLVLICIALGISIPIIAVVFVLFGSGEVDFPDSAIMDPHYYSEEVFLALFAIGFAIVVIVAAIAIIYYALSIKTINSIRKTIETGKMTGKISIFVAVMSIIYGAISGFVSLVSSVAGGALSLMALPSAAANILFGIVLFKLDSKLAAIAEQN